jgi:putative aminopeptidase FrvX
MQKSQFNLLKNILSQPTAPFRETHVIKTATDFLTAENIPFFKDPVGNVVVGVTSKSAYLDLISKTNKEPLRLFIAHTDHPGFHGVKWLGNKLLKIKWHGGSPVKHVSGARIWLATEKGLAAEGKLSQVKLSKPGYSIDTATVKISSDNFQPRPPAATRLYGGFKFRSPVWQSGQKLYCHAADDLVGVFCILATAGKVFGRPRAKKNLPFLGLLTRAEEVGFIGAIAHLDLDWLRKARRPILAVSLEASRTLPGAEIGKGPIVRLGDRRTVFSANELQVLTELATQTLKQKHQRRIMDGGTCEATVTTAYGLPTIALSVPLGNYHNQGFEGGADCRKPEGPAPEFVHLDDVDGQLDLCQALMQTDLRWKDPWHGVRERLQKNFQHYQRLLG